MLRSNPLGGKVIQQIHNTVGDNLVYLTFDIDSLDPAYAPGTGTPVPGGLTSAQALSIIRKLHAVNIIGADIVEVSPSYDHAEITALAAAHVGRDIITLIADKKRNSLSL
ncbi:MAG: arginase family protein [Burkholderiales bacterium]|nr:arginase family protein [Burkholderiales bacterium]